MCIRDRLSRGILTKNENKIVTFLIPKVAKASKIAKIEFGCFTSYSTPLDNSLAKKMVIIYRIIKIIIAITGFFEGLVFICLLYTSRCV